MALTLIYTTLLAFIPYFIAVWRPPSLKWIIAIAVAARLGMLLVPVTLSSDVYRYVWEGKVQNAGYNPYRFAPDAPELAGLRDANWERVEHREVPSAYPPLLLFVFRAGTTPLAFKLIFTLFDLATFWLLRRLARERAVIWAWNPLVILEFAGNAHSMSMAICFFVAALWLRERNRPWPATLALAGAVLSHGLAVPAAVAVLISKPWRNVRVWLLFAGTVGLAFLPFADAGTTALLGLVHVAGRWRFNGSVFEVLVGLTGGEYWREGFGGVWIAFEGPKRIAGMLVAAVTAWTVVRRYRPSRAALAVTGATLLLSSTVHPWYVTWLVALCCVEFRVPWLVLSAGMVLSYAARVTELTTGVWVDSAVVRWIEYTPFFALWLVDTVRRRQ